MKYIYIIVTFIFGFNELNAQTVLLNNFDINDAFNHQEVVNKIGVPDSVENGGNQSIVEFGWQTYIYYYGESSIDFNGVSSNSVTNIDINDVSLSINSIKIGEAISEAKNEFPNYRQKDSKIVIDFGDYAVLSFHYDSNNIITRISYIVFT